MYVIHKTDDPFVCFGAKPNKGLSPQSRRDRKWGREENASGIRKRDWEKVVGEGWCEWPVDTGEQKWPVGMSESSTSEGRPVKMCLHS